MQWLVDGDTLLRVALVLATIIGGFFAVRYQRQLALEAAYTKLTGVQKDTIEAMAARIEEAKEAMEDASEDATHTRLLSIRLAACERERTALQAIVDEWDRWIGNVWLEQARLSGEKPGGGDGDPVGD